MHGEGRGLERGPALVFHSRALAGRRGTAGAHPQGQRVAAQNPFPEKAAQASWAEREWPGAQSCLPRCRPRAPSQGQQSDAPPCMSPRACRCIFRPLKARSRQPSNRAWWCTPHAARQRTEGRAPTPAPPQVRTRRRRPPAGQPSAGHRQARDPSGASWILPLDFDTGQEGNSQSPCSPEGASLPTHARALHPEAQP